MKKKIASNPEFDKLSDEQQKRWIAEQISEDIDRTNFCSKNAHETASNVANALRKILKKLTQVEQDALKMWYGIDQERYPQEIAAEHIRPRKKPKEVEKVLKKLEAPIFREAVEEAVARVGLYDKKIEEQSNVLPHLCRRVDGFEFSDKVKTILAKKRIIYIGDLVQKTTEELTLWRGLNKRSLKEIKDTLAENYLHLDTNLSPEKMGGFDFSAWRNRQVWE